MRARGHETVRVDSKLKIAGLLVWALMPLAAMSKAQATGIPKHGKAIVLFDGKNLSQFDTFLPSAGLNADPKHVFSVENGVVHVSGDGDGLLRHQAGIQELLSARRVQVG
jgi:hypothetical protein